jgi:mannan endo-1,4-beta-mannosidase
MKNMVSRCNNYPLSSHADNDQGWLTPETRLAYLGRTENATRVEALSLWQKTSLQEKISDMYWQFGFSNYSYGRNHDDGFTIYLDE